MCEEEGLDEVSSDVVPEAVGVEFLRLAGGDKVWLESPVAEVDDSVPLAEAENSGGPEGDPERMVVTASAPETTLLVREDDNGELPGSETSAEDSS